MKSTLWPLLLPTSLSLRAELSRISQVWAKKTSSGEFINKSHVLPLLLLSQAGEGDALL